jgi:hypothetical protein
MRDFRAAGTTTDLTGTGEAARLAARRGWSVFPCLRDGDLDRDGHSAAKCPAVSRWEHRACADPDIVARYWPSRRHNVGIACGPSGLVVIDLDTHGELPFEWLIPGVVDGRDVFALLCEWAGQPWPVTFWTVTPSGGWHLYFRAPAGVEIRNSSWRLGPLIDVRAGGGYVLGAGSVVGGRTYEVLDNSDPAPLPGWLVRALTAAAPRTPPGPPHGDPGRRLGGLVRTVESAPEGQRNTVLHWAACRAGDLAADGEDPGQLAGHLVAAAVRAGLGEAEAARTVRSGLRGAA